MPTIRIYLTKLNIEMNFYEFEKELEAFSFKSVKDALDFVEELPNMSALELLLNINAANKKENVTN